MDGWVRVGSTEELSKQGMRVVSGVCVVAQPDGFFAVDNRCPHMGFPLSRGSVCDGILTCHWHHARFDVASGGTFDPFADDVETHEVRVLDGVVWVNPRPRPIADPAARWEARLREGLEQNLSLVTVKAVLGLLAATPGDAARRALSVGAAFGTRQRAAGWGSGLTILTAMGNVLDLLSSEDRALGLFHGLSHVADNCAGQPTRFQLEPLPQRDVPPERLAAWFRQFVAVRNGDGAQRALLTAIASGWSAAELCRLVGAAATDHYYLDGGHTLDFANKAFEMIELVGGGESATVLSSLVPGLVRAGRAEEQNAWRSPVDLVALTRPSIEHLPLELPARGQGWAGFDGLVAALLGEDPATSVAALDRAWSDGASLDEVSLALCYAAAMRIARFPTSNEFGDWVTALHTFTYCNALRRMLLRSPSPELARGLYHGAMSVYLDRFLNVPAARLPDGGAVSTIGDELLGLLDKQGQVAPAAELVDGFLRADGDEGALWRALGAALLREDAEFHTYQMYEGGWQVYRDLRDADCRDEARHVAIAVARYLAAHAPTHRELRQTARIAVRLQRGDDLAAEADG